jgi:DNA-binding GntR family transcriptional regulator
MSRHLQTDRTLASAGRMKGPANSIARDGDWSAGLEKARLYEEILLDIILGELPSMAVLDEKGLASRYAGGVSGVREALGRLALEGLVIRRPRVGTVVAPLEIGMIEQAFEVRYMLEARTAALAARKATAEDIERINTAFDGAESAIQARDFRAMLSMDRAFHRAVAMATNNSTLARYVVSLQNVAARFWIWEMEKQSPEDQLKDVALPRALGEAIANRDAQAAEAAGSKLLGDPPSASRA